MNRAEALEGLASVDQHVRLRAARYFQLAAEPSDLTAIQSAFDSEEVVWIRRALKDAILTASGGSPPDITPPELEEGVPRELYRKALGEATRSLVHEVRPLLGRLRMAAETEVEDYKSSRTAERIAQLVDLVSAIDDLRQATEAPRMEEFDLGEWVRTVVEDELVRDGFPEPVMVGKEHLIAFGDRGRLHLVLSNSLRNAREATVAAHPLTPPPVLISWGDTERDYWITVSDRGPGPPPGASFAFLPGQSTKQGHLGMGLAVAAAAMDSLAGQIELNRREHTPGACIEFRWPKRGT